MEKRTLGRTGHESTVVTFGAFGVGYTTQDEADEAIRLVLDHGVNHVDIAPSYGESMERMAPWMPEIRDSVFLGAKTRFRSRDEAWRDVESIMKRLNVEDFDLFQLHSVVNLDELDKATAKGGALETLVEMREQGVDEVAGYHGAWALCAEYDIRVAAPIRFRHGDVSAESGYGSRPGLPPRFGSAAGRGQRP